MFTKLAPHEDVGENVTFMVRFIILPSKEAGRFAAAVLQYRGMARANPHMA